MLGSVMCELSALLFSGWLGSCFPSSEMTKRKMVSAVPAVNCCLELSVKSQTVGGS